MAFPLSDSVFRGATVAACLFTAAGCHGSTDEQQAAQPSSDWRLGHNDISGYRQPGAPEGPPPVFTPSGHLLLTAERLAELATATATAEPEWLAFKQRVDGRWNDGNEYADSPQNRALVYLLTRDAKYSAGAYEWAKRIIDAADVQFDSYLHFGDRMRSIALVLDYCGDALDAGQRQVLADYLDRWTNELWFANKGTGWGLDDPGNNYHHAFLEGTAYAGYALRKVGAANGQKYIDLLHDKLTKPGGVLDYLDKELVGGDWREGANYGERSKERLFDALAVIASMGGPNYFYEHPFFAQSVYYAVYQLQPDGHSLDPAGDLARDSLMPVSVADRDYLETMSYWLADGEPRRLAQWYVDSMPAFGDGSGGNLGFVEIIFGGDRPQLSPAALPLGYLARGTGFVNWRSGWDAAATSLTISGAAIIDQSHQHLDVGSFVIFDRAWLALDATTLSAAGLNWSPGAHNAIHVPGAERLPGSVGGLRRLDDAGDVAYAQIDATDQYRNRPNGEIATMMKEVTREIVYLRPGTVITYDRVEPKNPSQTYEWRLHLPALPGGSSGRWHVASGGAGLTLMPLAAGTQAVVADGDLEGGPSSAWRVAEAPTGVASRYLNVIAVAAGDAPLAAARVASDGAAEGVETAGFVVMFSKNAFGAPALPFSYTLSGTHARSHVIANLDAAVDVSIAKHAGVTTVMVRPGTTHVPSTGGTVTIRE